MNDNEFKNAGKFDLIGLYKELTGKDPKFGNLGFGSRVDVAHVGDVWIYLYTMGYKVQSLELEFRDSGFEIDMEGSMELAPSYVQKEDANNYREIFKVLSKVKDFDKYFQKELIT